jgi:hypothetical protein
MAHLDKSGREYDLMDDKAICSVASTNDIP